jgi:hypothetical protein
VAWRVVHVGDRQWNVTMAAERRAHATAWKLVLSFRAVGSDPQSLWASYPLECASRSMLFAQAETIPDEALAAVLAERLG